jgi:predicted small secreted protein
VEEGRVVQDHLTSEGDVREGDVPRSMKAARAESLASRASCNTVEGNGKRIDAWPGKSAGVALARVGLASEWRAIIIMWDVWSWP